MHLSETLYKAAQNIQDIKNECITICTYIKVLSFCELYLKLFQKYKFVEKLHGPTKINEGYQLTFKTGW